MEVEIKRDGLVLRGEFLKAGEGVRPAAVLFHGFMSSRKPEGGILTLIADLLLERGVSVVRFDFNGHGESDGSFSDMSVMSELLDASKILEWALSREDVGEVYIAGHSQGGVVGGMTAGYYRDRVKKLLMLAPAAVIQRDALEGSCFGVRYDSENVPDYVRTHDLEGRPWDVGGFYFRSAKTLPIYETTGRFRGSTLIMYADNDPVVRRESVEPYRDFVEKLSISEIPGAGHGLTDCLAAETVEKAASFLAGRD